MSKELLDTLEEYMELNRATIQSLKNEVNDLNAVIDDLNKQITEMKAFMGAHSKWMRYKHKNAYWIMIESAITDKEVAKYCELFGQPYQGDEHETV